ncbi:NADH pyrophosphatase [Marasmius tenuissimus]|nr:NADH pyrophosphatase [Marasmius tenuissimus]
MNYTPTNFFSGSPLNRLSWLRPSHKFLNAILTSPNTRWFLFNAGQPLVSYRPSESKEKPLKKIAYFPTRPLLPLLGPSPFFGQSQTTGALLPDSEVTHSTEAARHLGIPVVFLGLHEQGTSGSALPEAEFKDNAEAAVQNLEGTPYFAVDVGDLETSEVDGVLRQVEEEQNVKFEWSEPRSAMGLMDPFEAAVFAEARSMVDWNYRHKVRELVREPKCGLKRLIHVPSSVQVVGHLSTRCGVVGSYHVPDFYLGAITTLKEETLPIWRKFPLKFYSALAGFIEPGESFEDSVMREMWEEAGVKVWDVTYHSAQPWPYPANLMVGYYARADSTKPVRTDLDNELMDARWYTREEILEVLAHQTGTRLDYKKFSQTEAQAEKAQSDLLQKQQQQWRTQQEQPGEGAGALAHSDPNIVAKQAIEKQPGADAALGVKVVSDEPAFRVPPVTAIAGVLIRDWAEKKIGFSPVQLPANL